LGGRGQRRADDWTTEAIWAVIKKSASSSSYHLFLSTVSRGGGDGSTGEKGKLCPWHREKKTDTKEIIRRRG